MKNRRFYISFILCLWLFSGVYAAEKIRYSYPFNPVKGLVNHEESDYRKELCLNGTWQFMPFYEAKAADFTLPPNFNWEEVPLKVPSPWNVNAFTDGTGGDFITYPSYPEEWKKAGIGWMKKEVFVPSDWSGRQLILHFEGVMGKTQVYVNGQKVTENFELFLPFEANVTDFLNPGQTNEILIGVAKASLFDDRGKYGRRTYVGGSMWGIEMAGIWQDVYLFAYPEVYVQDMFVQPDLKKGMLGIELEINNTTDLKKTITLDGEIRKWYNRAGLTVNELPEQKGETSTQSIVKLDGKKKITLDPRSVIKVRIERTITDELEYWSPDEPNLYGALVSLKDGKQLIDRKMERFGWRQFSIDGDRLLLNGKPISLHGDSWHFMGVPQMTRRYAWAWFDMLKSANANAVRFHAQPFPRFYLDVADEMGICVLDETGIWSSDGGPKIDSEDYWDSCAEHLRRLIKRDKNHASVFGWSVCNETVPVAVHVFKAPEELVQRQLKEINRWVKIAAEADPTREWISGDGETDRPTDLPVIVGHYGGTDGMKKWSSEGKPWGIGEQSMAYYGTPKQASVYNGNRAYESMQGRMEAIAVESYGLIKQQRELNASYSCVFNLAWYGLQPLELGLREVTRQSSLEDGIFFGFEEGKPGMQPERLGPYTTTLNPGYDPLLPLYRPWPMFDAVRCANATPIIPYQIEVPVENKTVQPVRPVESVLLIGASDSPLKDELEGLGIVVTAQGNITDKTLVIVDGKQITEDQKLQAQLKKAIESNARILIWGVTPGSLPVINACLPYQLTLEERRATSFLVQKNAAMLQGLGHADFYFSELIPRGKTAMYYGLSGDFAGKSNIWLRACNTDWQCWNYRAETSKTSFVFRSEREAKGADPVIASLRYNGAEIIVSTLDLSEIKNETQELVGKMFVNLGAEVSEKNLSSLRALDEKATLHRALVCGPFFGNESSVSGLLAKDLLGGEARLTPSLNEQSGGKSWKVATANEKGIFGISDLNAPNNSKNPVVYLSYWLYSPRSLSNLLAEPDMPSLDLYVKVNGGCTVWLNGNRVASQELPSGAEEIKIPNLMPDKGWNHFIIKVASSEDKKELKTGIRFWSADKDFMKQILSSVVR